MSLVTLSATYGAGGSEVGPALAQRLGVPFVDRLIPAQVADGLGVRNDEACAHDEVSQGLVARFLTNLAPAGQAFGTAAPAQRGLSERDFLAMTEQVIRERAASGQGVILGRAAAVVLSDDARGVHVRLDGPREARVLQAMRIQKIDRSTAERRLEDTDRARHAYVRHFYHEDARDPALYHLVIDSTAIDLAACVDLIARAAEDLAARQVVSG
jgi:cytidylate kinase